MQKFLYTVKLAYALTAHLIKAIYNAYSVRSLVYF